MTKPNPTQEQIEAADKLFAKLVPDTENPKLDFYIKKTPTSFDVATLLAQREAAARQQGIEEAASNYNQSDCLYECEVDDLRFVCTVPPEGAKVIKKYVRNLTQEVG